MHNAISTSPDCKCTTYSQSQRPTTTYPKRNLSIWSANSCSWHERCKSILFLFLQEKKTSFHIFTQNQWIQFHNKKMNQFKLKEHSSTHSHLASLPTPKSWRRIHHSKHTVNCPLNVASKIPMFEHRFHAAIQFVYSTHRPVLPRRISKTSSDTQSCAHDRPEFQPLPTNLGSMPYATHTNCTTPFQLRYSIDFERWCRAANENCDFSVNSLEFGIIFRLKSIKNENFWIF